MAAVFYAEVNIPRWISKVDFDRKPVNAAIGKEAREIRKIARRLISRRSISKAGDFPGRDTGALRRSVKVKLNRRFSFAVIRPTQTAEMGSFHPFMLLRGTKARLQKLKAGEGRGVSNRRGRNVRAAEIKARSASSEFIIEPRDDYMQEALNQRRYAARDAIATAVKNSLIPRAYGN